jgi:type IV secretory pathway VirB3-like protein
VTVIVSGLLYLILVLILVLLRKIIGKKEALFARFYYFGFLFIATVLGLASDFLPRDFKPLPI